MLTPEAIDVANDLAERLDRNGIMAVAIPAMPLGDLCAKTHVSPEFATIAQPNGEYDVIKEVIASGANTPIVVGDTEFNEHNDVMDDVVERAAAAVRGALVIAKTTVAAAVDDLVNRVAEGLNNTTIEGLLNLEVIPVGLPALLKERQFDELIRPFQTVPFNDFVWGIPTQMNDLGKIKEYLVTGSGGVDRAVEDWAAEMGDSCLLEMWAALYSGINAEGGVDVRPVTSWFADAECGVDYAIFAFLTARRIAEDIPEGVVANLATWQDACAALRDQAGADLCRRLEREEALVKGGVLVDRIVRNSIFVHETAYDEWLENGGECEILYGLAMTGKRVYNAADLLEQGPAFKGIWEQQSAALRVVESNRRFNRTKDFLYSAFIAQMNEIAEEEKAALGNIDAIVKLFHAELQLLTSTEMDNLYLAALRLLCRSRFQNTDAERILTSIHRIAEESPGIDVREAAALATIEYIADWMCSQLRVVPINAAV